MTLYLVQVVRRSESSRTGMKLLARTVRASSPGRAWDEMVLSTDGYGAVVDGWVTSDPVRIQEWIDSIA